MADDKHLTTELQFDAQFQTPSIGQSESIVITWKYDIVNLEEVSTISQGIRVMVKVIPSSSKCILFAIYASNCLNDKNRLWDYLEDLASFY